jgi:hypothetical protein
MLDVTLGDAEAAVQELEQALGDYEAQRPGPNYAWTTSQLAEALLARGRQGDRKRAAALLRDSLVMATSLGMVPLQQRCRRMAARAPAAAAG